jgi:peptide/nickel transport system permease protein
VTDVLVTPLELDRPEPGEAAEVRGGRTPWYRIPVLVAGLAIVGLMVLAAICAPLITSQSPTAQDLNHTLAPVGAHGHVLGTDQLGRDVLSRLLYGARIDYRIGFLAVVFMFTLGTLVGCVAGYVGGFVDTVIMRIVDVVVAFPFYVLVIALVFTLGAGTRSIYIAFTIVGWVSYARIVRGEILVAKQQEYLLAARAAGLGHVRLIGRHLLPNVITQAIVYSMSDIVLSILAVVTLGYLGIGVPPPTPDWGSMISDGQSLLSTNWELSTIPALALVVTGLGLALVADGLADALRP